MIKGEGGATVGYLISLSLIDSPDRDHTMALFKAVHWISSCMVMAWMFSLDIGIVFKCIGGAFVAAGLAGYWALEQTRKFETYTIETKPGQLEKKYNMPEGTIQRLYTQLCAKSKSLPFVDFLDTIESHMSKGWVDYIKSHRSGFRYYQTLATTGEQNPIHPDEQLAALRRIFLQAQVPKLLDDYVFEHLVK
jgi:hypothetical protein